MARRPALPPSGPAAFHEANRVRELATLQATIAQLRADLAGYVHPIAHRKALGEAVIRGWDGGFECGYRSGASDALEPLAPGHAKALAASGRGAG